MEQTWKIGGTYADWILTIAVRPPADEPEEFDVPEWPRTRFDPVAGHFREAVGYYELSRDAEADYD